MSRKPFLLTLALAALALPACESAVEPGGTPAPLQALPRALSAPEQRLVAASNAFAFGLLREVERGERGPNVFLSPLSASLALGMTTNGTRGATLDSMRAALGYAGVPLAEVNASYRSLIDLLRGLDPAAEMRIANSVWINRGFPVEPDFLRTTRTFFDAEAAELDFADPRSVERINAWVKAGTNGKIEKILEQIPPDVVMYLMNAIYFKGSWRERFDPQLTRDAPFRAASGASRTVKMMQLREGKVRFASVDGVQAVELPYGRGAFAMTIVLPEEGGELDRLVEEMDAAAWERLVAGLHDEQMDVFLPRFRLEYDRVLNEPLIDLGMGIAFRAGEADFSGLSPRGKGLYISEVKQKTFVEVNEEGTEAAAVTSVAVAERAASAFRVDRPFLVAIRERFSGTLLFLGKVGDPTAG